MTIITIDGVALADALTPIIPLFIGILTFLIFYYSVLMIIDIIKMQNKSNRYRYNYATEIYDKRKEEMKDNPKAWSKWMDANKHICKEVGYYL